MSKKLIGKPKRTKSRKTQPGSLHPAGSTASAWYLVGVRACAIWLRSKDLDETEVKAGITWQPNAPSQLAAAMVQDLTP